MAIVNYRATTLNRAFILNALATTLIALVTVEARFVIDRYTDVNNEFVSILMTLLIGFFSALIIYWVLFFIFGYGGGMLASDTNGKIF